MISTPMDLSFIRENLECDEYSAMNEVFRDIRLMITNSRKFNTNKRSRVRFRQLGFEDNSIFLKGFPVTVLETFWAYYDKGAAACYSLLLNKYNAYPIID